MTGDQLKYKGKYRVGSTRLLGWDYAAPSYYFVTLCTRRFIRWFGEVREEKVILSRAGQIAEEELERTTQIRHNVRIDPWSVMPNHVHAIIMIGDDPRITVETPRLDYVETPRRGVSTAPRQWRSGALGAIVNQIKSICTKRIRAIGVVDFSWQSRFYDRIIRNETEMEAVYAYILGNSIKWVEDEYY